MAKRTNYQGEKRAKELNRLKKQNEKKERKKQHEEGQPEELTPQAEGHTLPTQD